MLSLAIDALRRVAPDAIGGPLRFLSVIEEECTGNGTLASCLAGQLADAVVLAEPTGLDLLVAGVGILWLEIAITGKAAHAQSANEAINPIDASDPGHRSAPRARTRDERRRGRSGARRRRPSLQRQHRGDPRRRLGVERPGDRATRRPDRPPDRMDARRGRGARPIRRSMDATRDDRWLVEHPPSIRQTGFRAQGYSLAADASARGGARRRP